MNLAPISLALACLQVLIGMVFFSLLCCPAKAQTPSLADQANTLYTQHRYAESATLYRQVLLTLDSTPGQDERSSAEYNLACSEALAGQSDTALTDLEAAVHDGFTDAAHIAEDADLLSLHTDSRFVSAVSHAKMAMLLNDRRWGTTAFTTAYTSTLSDADKVAGLSLLWAEVKFGFGNQWHVPDLDWDQLYRDTIPKALAAHSTFDYYRVLQLMVAQLHDGHTNVYMPDPLHLGRLPFTTTLVDNRVLVSRLLSPPQGQQGLRLGDEILTVNGDPIRSWAAREVEPYQSASTPQDLAIRTFTYMLFVASSGTPFTLGVQSVKAGPPRLLHFTTGPYEAPEPPFAFKMLPGQIAYAALNEFGDDVDSKQWDAHWSEIATAKALILDLRRNGGGNDAIGAHILGTLLDKPVPVSLVRSTRWIASYQAWGRVQTPLTFPVEILAPDPKRHFAGPVVMLTGPRTYSAAEDMVVAFRSAKRGLIAGEATGGSTGQPLSFALPGGGSARVCTLHDSFADGTEFVGIGVQPDLPIPLTTDEVTGVEDVTLSRALTTLSSK